MTKAGLVTIVALVALSVWIGIQIDPGRDWGAWLFIAALPIALVAVAIWIQVKTAKDGGKNES